MEAKEGNYPHLRKWLETLIGTDALPHLLGWWHWRRKAILGKQYLHSQMPIFVGDSGIGKSHLQNITTRLSAVDPQALSLTWRARRTTANCSPPTIL